MNEGNFSEFGGILLDLDGENNEEEVQAGPAAKRRREDGDSGRCSKQAAKKYNAKERKFHGNRHSKNKIEKVTTPVSAKKLKKVKKKRKTELVEGYRLVDMELLSSLVMSLCCPECHQATLYLDEDQTKKKGLSSYLEVKCGNEDDDSGEICEFSSHIYTSKRTEKEETVKGVKPFDVNIRSVYAFRSIGVGYNGLEKCVGLLNMPPPMTVNNFSKVSNNIKDSAQKVAETSMLDAAKEAVSAKQSTDIGVSVDGTWQRRGYTSLNGVIVAISMGERGVGKVVDVEILSRYCRLCDVKRRQLNNNAEFNEWFKAHKPNCTLNHQGTAPAMEAEGAKRIFERSIKERGVRYTEYYGDGDSKGYMSIQHIYLNIEVLKRECIGHYQKRVGNRLLKLKKNTKGLKELTKPLIDKFQNYFGIALRSNCKSVKDMQSAILASFLHIASSKEHNFHGQCNASWCQYKKDQINKTNLYKPGKGLSMPVIKLVRPIYMDLIDAKELEKCLHGKTQNQNESFNNMVWERVPKHTYVGVDKMRLGVYDAIANFNDGRQGSIDILKNLGLVPGYFTTRSCFNLNKRRKLSSWYKSSAKAKKARKIIRANKKTQTHNLKQKEGKTYKKGGF